MKNGLRNAIARCAVLAVFLLVLAPQVAFGQEEEAGVVSHEMFTVNNTWMLVAAFLVFIMHLGFACLESGLTQAKNTVNILFKNISIVAIGLLTYAVVGFNLMYPGDFALEGVLGFAGFGLDPGVDGNTVAYADGAYTYWTDFIFQAMFAATRRHHRLRRRGGAHQACPLPRLHEHLRGAGVPHRRLMEMGRRVVGRDGLLRFRWLHPRALRRRMGGARRDYRPRPPARKVRRWASHSHRGSQHAPRRRLASSCCGWDGTASTVGRS